MEKKIKATYIGDSKYFHFFHIDGGQGFMGNIYVPKDKPIPLTLTIHLRTKSEAEAEQKPS